MPSRRFASLGAALLFLASGGHAVAQSPPPDPLPSAPTLAPALAPAPASAMPPGYAIPSWYAMPPYTPMKRRSPGMIAAGVVLISLATVGAIGGTSLFMSGSQPQEVIPLPPCCEGCGVCGGGLGALSSDGSGLRTAGIASIAFSVAAMGAGLPLLVVGSKKVPDRGDASLVPAVRFGSGGGSLSWRF